jgi:hypothetical protein
MARTEAIGDEPIAFFTDDGQQVFLPVDDIFFDSGAVGSKTKPSLPSSPLGLWLKYLVAQGRLAPAPTPAPGPAMVFTAVSAGSTGKNIVVTVTANGPTQVDIKVVATDTYEGLTLDSTSPNYLPKVLGDGTQAKPGIRPGLVGVKPITGTPPDPEEGVIKVAASTTPITVPGPGAAASFILEPRRLGSDAAGSQSGQPKWTIEVSDLQPAAAGKTFTLKVAWTNTVTVGDADLSVAADTSGSKLFPLAFAVTIAKPDGSTSLALPRPGLPVTLLGGAEAADPKKAKATLQVKA